jgi:hypothetical protein
LLLCIGGFYQQHTDKKAVALLASACRIRHNQPATPHRRRHQNTTASQAHWLLLKKEGPTATTNKAKKLALPKQLAAKNCHRTNAKTTTWQTLKSNVPSQF